MDLTNKKTLDLANLFLDENNNVIAIDYMDIFDYEFPIIYRMAIQLTDDIDRPTIGQMFDGELMKFV